MLNVIHLSCYSISKMRGKREGMRGMREKER
jgi:hypothetical protein